MMTTFIPPVRRGAEPFFFDGESDHAAVGCVLAHGFTASPEEMRWLGEHLNAQGLTVYCPRLAGHGLTPARMRPQHWLDWYDDVRDAAILLRARCRKVYAVGLSMGGLLSLQVAAAGLVDGAVIMAAPFYVESSLLPYARWLKYVVRFRRANPGDLDARVREAQRVMGREDYGRAAYDDFTPVASAEQLYNLMNNTRKKLDLITVPLLALYSRADQTVPFDNLQILLNGVVHADVTHHVFKKSDHVLTQDIEREKVFALVWNWLSARMY